MNSRNYKTLNTLRYSKEYFMDTNPPVEQQTTRIPNVKPTRIPNVQPPKPTREPPKDNCVHIRYEKEELYNTASPKVFGPPLWFSLHNGAAHYPMNPSPIVKERMKHLILGIPVLTPCKNCSEHATAYVEKNYDNLDDICSSRDKLFKFFVDFHNEVNKRLNKPIMSYEDAYKLYLGNVKISPMSYNVKKI